MPKEINKKLIENSIYNILVALGENPEREGLRETPQRVSNMYEEIFQGIKYSNEEIAEMFNKSFEINDNPCKGSNLVVIRDISAFSYCEHHMALMYDMKITVAYIPKGKVLGLSKIIRVVDMVTKRLQLQERIGLDIAEIIGLMAETEDVAVKIEGKHSCVTARGIKNNEAITLTEIFKGRFENDLILQKRLCV